MSKSPFSVGIIQETAAPDRAANVERQIGRIREAHGRGAQIICLQELFNAPYFCKSLKMEWFDIAEPIPGPTVERLQKLAGELAIVLIIPIYERQAAGLYRNSAAVVDADGSLLGVYRKMHIPHDPLFEEKYYFAPGDTHDPPPAAPGAARTSNGFRVFKTRYADVGVLICWDQWYPEAARITSLLGAEILYAARGEMALKLGDAVIRRTEAGAAGHPGSDALDHAAAIMGRAHGWDEWRLRSEVAEVEAFYRLPRE